MVGEHYSSVVVLVQERAWSEDVYNISLGLRITLVSHMAPKIKVGCVSHQGSYKNPRVNCVKYQSMRGKIYIKKKQTNKKKIYHLF